jgi:hypothetical protein
MGDTKTLLKAAFLLSIGFAQMAGLLFHWGSLADFGFATNASPAPQVFCRLDNIESFACYYSLEWRDPSGQDHETPLGAGSEGLIPGPQARRSMVLATLRGEGAQKGTPAWSARRFELCGPLLPQMGLQPKDVLWPVFLKVVTPGDSLVPRIAIPIDREACR